MTLWANVKLAVALLAAVLVVGTGCVGAQERAPEAARVAGADHSASPTDLPAGEAEPACSGTFCRYKCPGPGMKFTEGVPLRVLADAVDINGWQTKAGKSQAGEVRFFVDGKLMATVPPLAEGYNHFEAFIKDVAAGTHVLTVESTNFGGKICKGWPITISVEAPAAHANTVNLTQDMMLSGAANLNWENTTVKGNGFKVRSAENWTGSVVIRNSFVTGLGDLTNNGIDVTTSAGSVSIENSIFEGTGAVYLTVNGAGTFSVKENEFRASNLVQFVSSNPEKSPVFCAHGNCSGAKVFQGNRVASGLVRFEGMSGWQIGGKSDEESNILIGPRCVIALQNCRDCEIRGNYMNHDYYGGWSQGYNLCCQGVQNILAEHNVIRAGSWPVQNFGGEFRYNLLIDSGHEFVRSLVSNTKLHHNVFAHTSSAGGDVNSGIWMYTGEKNVAIFNNTFDCGAPAVKTFPAPIVDVSKSCSASLRNNIFMGSSLPDNWPRVTRKPIISGDPGCITAADYNCFFNPQTPKVPNYLDGVVTGKAGEHDINADPKFTAGEICPYPMNQAEIWNRKYKVSQVLAYYRARYAPAAGSPVLGAGDPADGKDSYIGAIGTGKDAVDLFGKFGNLGKEKGK